MSTVTLPVGEVAKEADRRRTFAVISHPDAGKSTMTEALALHAKALTTAGAVHGKDGRKGVTSDWLEMEQARGISITSAALQFEYEGIVINLLDTPGHADFSEDTYRVLSAVDSAVMLLDAAKGLEPQTLKLFEVCRQRGIPVITFINKWDRPGMDPIELCEELTDRINLPPMPLTWPVGIAGDFRGVRDLRTGNMIRYNRAAASGKIAPEQELAPADALAQEDGDWTNSVEESELLRASGGEFDLDRYNDAEATPVLFGAAVLNFGVRHLLDLLVELAPRPTAKLDVNDRPREVDAPFSGFVFKVQTGMDRNHRDQVAFARVCSGKFERGMTVVNATTKRPFSTKYVQQIFGQERTTLDIAYPGDVIGLVNATALRIGDTLYADTPAVRYPGLPTFSPGHFAVARPKTLGKAKQFRKAVDQMGSEGVVQVLYSDRRGEGAPVFAAVGPMQFEVAAHRMDAEFGVEIILDRLPYSTVGRVDNPEHRLIIDRANRSEVLQRSDGVHLGLFADDIALGVLRRMNPELEIETLVSGM